jgi:exopolysaccharide biosynthesis polyprenyl glycosylphosphotransferase
MEITQMDAQEWGGQLSGPLPVAINARWAERILLFIALTTTDLLMVLSGFWLAYTIRFEVDIPWFYYPMESPLYFYSRLVFILAPAWLIVFRLFGLYDVTNLFGGMQEYSRVLNACTLSMMLIILSSFFDLTFDIARGWVILSWGAVTFTVLMGRFLLRRVVQRLRSKGRFLTTVLIIGANEEGMAIAKQLQDDAKSGIWIAGFADDEAARGTELLPGTSVLGSTDSVAALVRYHGIQEIIVATTALSREKLLELFQTFGADDNIVLRMSSGLYEIMTTGVQVREFGNVPLLSINKVRLTGAELLMKRSLDLLISAIASFLLLPIMLVIAIAIKLDSPGPILYRRRVVGVGGKLFDALKFRTMYIDADDRLARDVALREQFEKNYKLKDDPRVMRVGRILRRTSLDELPQLFNVLKGQMSLVGPRMITWEERQRYGKWRMNLSTVKPGITGLWQVSGRSEISYEERVKLDMHYIRNFSIWLDLHLLWRTIPAVLKGHGAY